MMQIAAASLASYLCTLSTLKALNNSPFAFLSVSVDKIKKNIFIRCYANQYEANVLIDFPNGYPRYDRLLPCPLEHVPPRVEHLIVTKGEVVLDYICKALHLPPLCYEIDWMSRIIGVTDMYVVLDKPFATSVGGTTNNIEETCVKFASRALALETPLRTTHQLDNCTEGCLLLAKTQDFCSAFHGMIRENKVSKQYLALTAAPVPIGVISHYMKPAKLAPKFVSEDYIEGWQICKLEVLDCKKVSWPNSVVEKHYSFDDCGWSNKTYAYECVIKLITGKTHQIRAQLAAIGAPIIGDSMYTAAAIAQLKNLNINPFLEGSKLNYAIEEEKSKSVEDWASCHGKEPRTMIGLQASKLSWDEGNCCYKAGPPWWRRIIA